jgi:hypothetical protein
LSAVGDGGSLKASRVATPTAAQRATVNEIRTVAGLRGARRGARELLMV